MVIKVMVADDQALIRESLKIILSAHPDIEVVATVEDGNHVLSSIPLLVIFFFTSKQFISGLTSGAF